MKFVDIDIAGACFVKMEELKDDRGFFARSFCRREFEEHGLNPNVAQCNVSLNQYKGTLRGLHSQAWPNEEAKLVRCTQGVIYDVILDLRPDSETFLTHFGVELSAKNHVMLYVPEGVYHGFLTLEDNTEVFYQMSEFYHPDKALGVRWNDPAFGIKWPIEVSQISDKDRSYPDYVVPRK
jgi:dTDP-4-dehydrorhamnose 3,5-epimerase